MNAPRASSKARVAISITPGILSSVAVKGIAPPADSSRNLFEPRGAYNAQFYGRYPASVGRRRANDRVEHRTTSLVRKAFQQVPTARRHDVCRRDAKVCHHLPGFVHRGAPVVIADADEQAD